MGEFKFKCWDSFYFKIRFILLRFEFILYGIGAVVKKEMMFFFCLKFILRSLIGKKTCFINTFENLTLF